MRITRRPQCFPLVMGAIAMVSITMVNASFGQSPGDTRYGVPTTPAYRYFTGNTHHQHRGNAQPIRNAAPKAESVQQTGRKPFEDVQHGPTLSPYLTLDIIESGTGLPNYYAFTRPMIQQTQTNEAQARELRKLRQQVRTGNSGALNLRTAGRGMPTTGGSNQFQNLGSFYPGLR